MEMNKTFKLKGNEIIAYQTLQLKWCNIAKIIHTPKWVSSLYNFRKEKPDTEIQFCTLNSVKKKKKAILIYGVANWDSSYSGRDRC